MYMNFTGFLKCNTNTTATTRSNTNSSGGRFMKHVHVTCHTYAGPDPGRCNRCKCIGQKKIADAFIGQIFTANNKKQHFLRKHKAYNLQNATKLIFPRNDYDTYSEFTPERFVFPKTCPRTITLTFPPLIHTAMFQYLLFNDVNIIYYVFESACIKCVYAITHMSDYPLYVKYNQLRSQNYLPIHVNMLVYQVLRNFKFNPRALNTLAVAGSAAALL